MSDDDLIRGGEVCEILGVSRTTLGNWRRTGYGPAFVRIGGVVKYRRGLVEAFLRAAESQTAEKGQIIGKVPQEPPAAPKPPIEDDLP